MSPKVGSGESRGPASTSSAPSSPFYFSSPLHCDARSYDAPDLFNQDWLGIVKSEVFAVNAVQRRISWHRNLLFANELESSHRKIPSLLVVSENDKVVPSLAVEHHIHEHQSLMRTTSDTSSCVDVAVLKSAEHGSLVFDAIVRDNVIGQIAAAVGKWG